MTGTQTTTPSSVSRVPETRKQQTDYLQENISLNKMEDVLKEEADLMRLRKILEAREIKVLARRQEFSKLEDVVNPLLEKFEGIDVEDIDALLKYKKRPTAEISV